MNIKPIKTRKDYENALKFIEENFDAKPNTSEGERVIILSILIEKYEEEHFPIDAPDPLEAIKFRMEQLGLTNRDLATLIGGRNRVSELFNKKRSLTLTMMKSLHKEW